METTQKSTETLYEVIEDIADKLYIYGCGDFNLPEETRHIDCNCRICFTSNLDDRIRKAIKLEKEIIIL